MFHFFNLSSDSYCISKDFQLPVYLHPNESMNREIIVFECNGKVNINKKSISPSSHNPCSKNCQISLQPIKAVIVPTINHEIETDPLRPSAEQFGTGKGKPSTLLLFPILQFHLSLIRAEASNPAVFVICTKPRDGTVCFKFFQRANFSLPSVCQSKVKLLRVHSY